MFNEYEWMVSQGWSPDVLKSMGIFPTTPEQQAGIDAFNAAISANLKKTAAEMGLDLGADLGAPVTPKTYTPEEIKKINADAAAAEAAVVKTMAENEAKQKAARETNYKTVRSQLENQYNNLVGFDSRLAYQGRSSDLPAIFNQQAAQLADAGVSDISNLRVQDGRLIDSSTGRTVSTSNLGGQVAVDRDTGVQKWGDIFSGVKGGANYGIQTAQDGSVILFPAWEKTKSPIAQIGLGGLESVIAPALTIAGAYFGAPQLGGALGGAVGGAAGGAAIGNTAGQLLASGEVDWERVALSAGGAAAGQAIFGPGAAEAGSATEAGMVGTPGVSTVYPVAPPNIGVAPLAPQAGAAVGAGTEGLLGTGISGGGLSSADMAALKTGAGYGETTQSLLNADLDFISADAAQLWKQTGDVAAVQQNLIAAGVDPIMAAEASNLAALGGTTQSISSALGQAFPGETVFTSEGLLSGGSTLDDFAKDIGGGITSTAGAAGLGLTTKDAVLAASTLAAGAKQQPQAYRSGYGGGQPAGVDASGLLALLQGKAGVPNVSPLIAPVVSPVVSPYEPLLGQQPQYQSLLGRTQQSLLG